MSSIMGIIFDMDNTVLRSKIDFDAIKYELFNFLITEGILESSFPIKLHTSSTIIELVQRSTDWCNETKEVIWDICERFEEIGMREAVLEDGAKELIEQLYEKYHLVILTNNSQFAAKTALEKTEIYQYFQHVVGREQMEYLKPSPSGVLYILNQYRKIRPENWLSIGDAWVDGKASLDVGVNFLAYQANVKKMEENQVVPIGYISHLNEVIHYLY